MKKVVANGENGAVDDRPSHCLDLLRRVTTKLKLKIGSDSAKEYPG